MTAENERNDLPKKKSSFLRRLFFFFIFLFISILFIAFVFVMRGGSLATGAVSGAAEKYFSHFAYLSVNFKNLSGNPFAGYTLEGLTVGDKTTSDIVVAKKIFVEIDGAESWAMRKIVLRGSVDGLRAKESKMNELLFALKEEFQLGSESEDFAPLAFVVPKDFSGTDWEGDSGWRIAKISFNREVPGKLIYKFSADAEYRTEQIQLDGKTELTEKGLPLWADLRLRARESDVIAQASLDDGRVSLKNIEGMFLNSPLKGNASIDFATEDPEISADFSLRSADLSPLRQLVPDLGSMTVDNLSAHISGSLAHPRGEFSLENGNFEWRAYKFSGVQANGFSDGKNLSVNFSADALGATIKASGVFGLTENCPLNAEASIESFRVQELEKFFPELEPAAAEGLVSAKITASGTLAQPTAFVNLRSPEISLRQKYVFSDLGASLIATKSKLTLQNFSADVFKGKISASGSVALGKNSPSLALDGNLSRFDLGAVSDVAGKLDGNFSLGGTVARPQVALEAKIDSLSYAQLALKNITLTARGNDVLELQLQGFTEKNTPLGGGGKITMRGARSAMDLKFNLDRLKLSELFPHTMKIAGEISAVLLVGGTFENPDVSATVRGPEIIAGGYKIASPLLKAVLNGRKIDIDASVTVGDRRPFIKGTLDFESGSKEVGETVEIRGESVPEIGAANFKRGFQCVLDIAAPSVRIDFLVPSLAGKVYGRVTMKSRAVITENGVEMTGSITSPTLGASGIRATNVIVPFAFKDKKFKISDGILTLGGGTINLEADGNAESGDYTFALRGKDIDLENLSASLDLPAQIEGSAEVTFAGRVSSGFTTLVRAGGRIHLKDLSIDKFHGQTAIIGNSPFRVEAGNIFFIIDDHEIYLMPGSAISAPSGDRIYNFISFTGTLWKIRRDAPNLDPEFLPEDLLEKNNDMYHILVNGSINLRILNGLLSGFGAVMDAGASGDMSTESIASSFVQRYIRGRFGTQYRAFELDIAGKDYHELRINHLKFEGEGNFAEPDTTDWRRDSRQAKDFQRYSFNYGLPLGRDPQREKKKKSKQEQKQEAAAQNSFDSGDEN